MSRVTLFTDTKTALPYGIEIEYTDQIDNVKIVGPLILGQDDDLLFKHITMELREHERVYLIEGRYNQECITYLFMVTNQGKYIECGEPETPGEEFCWIFPEDYYFCGMIGGTSQNAIAFIRPHLLNKSRRKLHS